MTKCRYKRCDRPVTNKGLRMCNPHYQAYRRRNNLNTECSVTGCQQEARSKGLCRTHFRWLRETGDPTKQPERKPFVHPMVKCAVPGCPNETSAIQGCGLCHTHSSRLSQGLDLNTPLTPGKRGRKPYIPGIPQHLRDAMTRLSLDSRVGNKPSRETLDLVAEYNRMVKAWRLTQRPPDRVLAELRR